MESIREAIQAMLDGVGDGYQLGPFVISMGLERLTGEGVEGTHWYCIPTGQATWITAGLLMATEDMIHQDVDD